MRATKFRIIPAVSLMLLCLFAGASAQTTTAFVERFDTTAVPNFPLFWTQTRLSGTGITWVTTDTSPNSPPNVAFGNEPAGINATAITTPTFTVNSPAATLRFKTSYNLEAATGVAFDGMVLEIKIGANIPTDIVAAGGTFFSGGYTHTVSTQFGSPIAGRRAWSGNSAGYSTCTVRLPAFAQGQAVQLRWILATDDTVGGAGARIDDIQVANGNFYMAPFDFDGDFKTDIGIFRPAGAEWWINRSSNGSTFALQFGTSTDRIVPADYTGDGKTDIAFWRPTDGNWYVLRSDDSSFFAFPFGANGDVPAPADYDGDGRADAAVFRPSTATWFISQSAGGGTRIFQFGAAADKPIVGDYDGDGKADVAIWRSAGGGAEWWINRSTAGLIAMQFGASSDKPVVGDYTGDRRTDVAFWRPASGEWYIIRSEDSSFFAFPFGANGDTPAPGDYDSDAKTDPAVFRPSSATWFVARSIAGTQIVQFGANGDRPLPNSFVP